MAKSGLEKRQIGKKRKEADERHATLFSFYCLPLRYILTPGTIHVNHYHIYIILFTSGRLLYVHASEA
jgi:hypothetical protein